MAEEFKRLLATVTPEQIASDRSSLGIPDDYALRVPAGEAQPLADLLRRLDESAAS